MKTFTEATEKKMGKLFQAFTTAPELVGYITNGVPVALATSLRKRMIDNPQQETKITIGDLMEFTLKVGKRGDSVALTPDFTILEGGLELISKDSVDIDENDMEALAISIMEDEELLEAFKNCMSNMIYNDTEWIDESKEKEKGLIFDEEADVAVSAASVLLTILEILANNKDAAQEVQYEVPGLGIFTIKETKGVWGCSLSYDKAYKANCKSDAVVNAISQLDLG